MKLPDAMYCAIGLGPSNLSLGALAKTAGLEGIHLERNHEFRWHPGMLLDDATIQVPMLKDLVSAVEPGNPPELYQLLGPARAILRTPQLWL